MIFEGSAAAVVTPMAENGAIDFEAMGKLLEFQLENGTDAIVVNGTTGESSTLQDEEKYKLIEFTVKRVHGRVPVIAGAGSNNTAHAVELSKKAQELGADGLLEVTPYYNKTSQKGLIAHFTACILYTSPSPRDYAASRMPSFFFNDTATTEIYTSSFVGSVRCV